MSWKNTNLVNDGSAGTIIISPIANTNYFVILNLSERPMPTEHWTQFKRNIVDKEFIVDNVVQHKSCITYSGIFWLQMKDYAIRCTQYVFDINLMTNQKKANRQRYLH